MPVVAVDSENNRGKAAKDGFLFRGHPIFLGYAAGSDIVRMDEGNHMRETEVVEGVIAHRAGRFGGEALTPIGRIQPVSDLQLFPAVHGLQEEAAVTDQFLLRTKDQGELRR